MDDAVATPTEQGESNGKRSAEDVDKWCHDVASNLSDVLLQNLTVVRFGVLAGLCYISSNQLILYHIVTDLSSLSGEVWLVSPCVNGYEWVDWCSAVGFGVFVQCAAHECRYCVALFFG